MRGTNAKKKKKTYLSNNKIHFKKVFKINYIIFLKITCLNYLQLVLSLDLLSLDILSSFLEENTRIHPIISHCDFLSICGRYANLYTAL